MRERLAFHADKQERLTLGRCNIDLERRTEMIGIHRNTPSKAVKGLIDHRSLQRFSVIPILFALIGCSTAANVESLPDSVKAEMDAVAIAATVKPDAVV